MDKQFDELKSVLTEELNIHTDLVKTAEEMNAAIKEKDINQVQRLTAKYDAHIGQIEFLEIRRLELCDGITKTLKPENRHMNLQNIIALMPEEEQESLFNIRKSLKSKISELSKINTSNQLLLNESLAAIDKNFELINQCQNRLAGYKQTGTMDKDTVRKNIVNHIA